MRFSVSPHYTVLTYKIQDMDADSAFSVKHERAEDLPTKVDPGQATLVKEESAQVILYLHLSFFSYTHCARIVGPLQDVFVSLWS